MVAVQLFVLSNGDGLLLWSDITYLKSCENLLIESYYAIYVVYETSSIISQWVIGTWRDIRLHL